MGRKGGMPGCLQTVNNYFGSRYLEKKTGKKPVVYVSDAAHYSNMRLSAKFYISLWYEITISYIIVKEEIKIFISEVDDYDSGD